MGSGYPLVRFRHLRPTVGGSGYSPAAGGGSGAQPDQIRFRPGPQTAPPLPIPGAGGSGPIGGVGVLDGGTYGLPLGLWKFNLDPDAFEDLAWRWIHHDAVLSEDAGDNATVGADGTAFDGGPSAGVPGALPYVGLTYNPVQYGSGNSIVDQGTTPVWTLAIWWENPSHPALHSTSPIAPSPGTTLPVPIFGRIYTNSFIVGYQWSYTWAGVPGDWDAVGWALQPFVAVGGSGGTTVTIAVAGPPLTLIEFDAPHSSITSLDPASGSVLGEATIPWVWSGGIWPNDDQVFGGGNMGPYYWSSWRHPTATIEAAGVFGLPLESTASVISSSAFAPQHGPKTLHAVRFRPARGPQAPTGSRLSEYSHYWPLADASPGPMLDVIAGAQLTVQSRSLATFQHYQEEGPFADDPAPADLDGPDPDDRPGLRLTQPSRSAYAYMQRDLSHPATIGAGGVGRDFTISLWLAWEGPQAGYMGPVFPLVLSTEVPHGPGSVTAVQIYLGSALAEPYGASFDTWSAAGSTMDKLWTQNAVIVVGGLPYVAPFDWPAARFESHPHDKQPTWALAAFVYRTGSGAIQKEIWVDGALIVSAAADAGGWGASADIATVGGSAPALLSGIGQGAQGTFRDLSFYPFALSADDLTYAPSA